jgi:methionine synthase I (cobalamin-dependent)/5,10-methylenetetrahydrofolate reductase
MSEKRKSQSAANKFRRLLESSQPILGDGAMGTILNTRGIGFDRCFDELNLTDPARVIEIHSSYIEAGSQIIQTNTFGANRYKLALHALADQVVEINRAGVALAKRAVQTSSKDVWVAGDIGPLGVRLTPFGRVKPEQALQVFKEQIAALWEAGVDLLIIETMSDIHETQQAILAARELCDLPLVASMTFTRDDRTLLGDTPSRVAKELLDSGADVIGINCSGGPAQVLRILRQMKAAVPAGRFSVMPNAGWPEQVGDRVMYPAHPDYFGEYATAFCEAGANLIGGCCGTTPAHIAAMHSSLEKTPQGCGDLLGEFLSAVENGDSLAILDRPTCLAEKMAAGKFVISVEIDPPKGQSVHKLLAGASLLAEAGADVINVADSPMARMRMSPWAVCALLQRELGIETTLHFPTRGRNLLRVQGDLLAAHALSIRNIFVIMGDPTAIGDYPDAADNFDLVPSGLIKLIKQNFNAGVDHAGDTIGQPTSFFVGSALNLNPTDVEREIKNLRRKVLAGSDFFLTQPVFQPAAAGQFINRYQDLHGPLDTPVLVGVLPLFGSRHAAFLHNEVPGINISPEIQARLEKSGEEAPQEGVRIALELVEQARDWANGIYLMPAFGRYEIAAQIIDELRE